MIYSIAVLCFRVSHRWFILRFVTIMVTGEVLLLLVSIFHIQIHFVGSETTVEVTTPLSPVIVGGVLAVQCKIWDIQNGDTVVITRTFDGGAEQISSSDNILRSSVQDRVFLAIRTFSDGSVLYFLTMLDIRASDSGEYACSISRMSGAIPSAIDHDSIDIEIFSFPDKSQPSCMGNPQSLMLMEGSILELTCSSYTRTIPIVNLIWRSLSTYEYLQSTDLSEGDSVVSNLHITIQREHHGTIFRCEMTSQGFPDRMQSCEIGPISVMSVADNVNRDFALTTAKPKDVISLKTSEPTEDCQNTCKSSSDTVFYLTVSTATICLLAIVFLITTIIMCCKYNSISTRVTQRRAPSPPSLASDPVYVSLQRRNTNERVYMTLEDPNNPDGKVLLPKEVFDEFYNRTLTLRKT